MKNFNEIIDQLTKNDSALTFLFLVKNAIGPARAEALAGALKTNTSLVEINLENNTIGAAGAQALSEILEINTSLLSLNLWDNNIPSPGAKALARALKSNTRLTSLNLGCNDIFYTGAQALAEALKVNASLKFLSLSRNYIGPTGAQALAEALKINDSLTSLNLNFNEIGDTCAHSMAEALKINTRLTELWLGRNQIGDMGAQALAQALEINTSLVSLSLEDNNIGDAGAEALAKALETNISLTRLGLRCNNIHKDLIRRIDSLLGRNNYITRLKEDIQALEKAAYNEKTINKLNEAFVDLEQRIGKYEFTYPDIYSHLQNQLNACAVTQSLKQDDFLTALKLYHEDLPVKEETLHALGEQMYALSFKLNPLFKGSGLKANTKVYAALAVLAKVYHRADAQQLIQHIIGNMVNEKMCNDLGVSQVVPEAILMSTIGRLSEMNPQEVYEACQKEPLKSTLEHRFGTSAIISIESAVRFRDTFKFPVKTENNRASEGKQEADAGSAQEHQSEERISSSRDIKSEYLAPFMKAFTDYARAVTEQQVDTPMSAAFASSSSSIDADGSKQKDDSSRASNEFTDLTESQQVDLFVSDNSQQTVQDDESSVDYREQIIEKINDYLSFKASLTHFKIDKARQTPGFFTRVRHWGGKGQERAERLIEELRPSQDLRRINQIIAELLSHEETAYHKNSLASFVLDAVCKLNVSPWYDIKPDGWGHYSKMQAVDICEKLKPSLECISKSGY